MTLATHTHFFERVRICGNPVANPTCIVYSGAARFTVLTSHLIRLEWSATGTFENRGTFAFPSRYTAEHCALTVQDDDGSLTIDTGMLRLHYRGDNRPFSADNLSITFTLEGDQHTWYPGLPDTGNLGGTRRALDETRDAVQLAKGLISRAGWVVYDDSGSIVFNPADGWVTQREAGADDQDWYFFGYGHDYKAALADYIRFGGPIQLIPRFVLGIWWSRYWAYTDTELKAVAEGFTLHGLPLDVLVIDMNWHMPHHWTGYTWNRDLFPDPPAFLAWAHARGLRITLNLHPAGGVQPFEERYAEFASAMNMDPAQNVTCPFAITDRHFTAHYFSLLHHPLEDQGIDFWWVDWQQGEPCDLPELDPLIWLNHLHFHDASRRGTRPLILSRWGGFGNHRYQIGFSGDTDATWTALQFQPYFNATAANVCHGWWSHDIGGHYSVTDPELFVRWVQFGALSPCMRLHSTKDPLAERRPWTFGEDVLSATREAFALRYRLVLYLYTLARIAMDTGVAPCHPLYYEYPKLEDAYVARYQYFLGDQLIAVPIVCPADPTIGMAKADAWVPPGEWIDLATGETFRGPRWVRLVGDLHRVPLLARSGAILPLAPSAMTIGAIPNDVLYLQILPGSHGAFRLYEDDGTTEAYSVGQYEWTAFTMEALDPSTCAIHILPVEGRCATLPAARRYEIQLSWTRHPACVLVDGVETGNWTYDAEQLTTRITIPQRDKSQATSIMVISAGSLTAISDEHNSSVVRADIMRLLGDATPAVPWEAWPATIAQLPIVTPGRADALARLGYPFTFIIEYGVIDEAVRQLATLIVAAPADQSAFDAAITWTVVGPEGPITHHQNFLQSSEVLIVHSPFAIDTDAIQTTRWTVNVQVRWQGMGHIFTHQGRSVFPAITSWRVVLFNREVAPLGPSQVMDAEGRLNEALYWERWQESLAQMEHVAYPTMVKLFERCYERLLAQEPLAAWVTTTITSWEEREVVVEYWSQEPVQLWLNGQLVQDKITKTGTMLGQTMFGHATQQAKVVLRKGANFLVALTRPSHTNIYWKFCAVLTTVDGLVMPDLFAA